MSQHAIAAVDAAPDNTLSTTLNMIFIAAASAAIKTANKTLLPALIFATSLAQAQTISTIAGTGVTGFSGDGGPALAATFNFSKLAVDGAGNIYVADALNNRIRRIDASSGVVTTVAGTGVRGFSGDGGPATAAELFVPQKVAIDSAGNLIIADTENGCIRRVSATSGIITRIAGTGVFDFQHDGGAGDGGPATAAPLGALHGVAVDRDGNVFIAATDDCRIRRVDAVSGIITTVAGSTCGFGGDGGPATAAQMANLFDVEVDGAGNLIIIDTFNNRVRRVDAQSGFMTTLAGNGTAGFGGDAGPATAAMLNFPGDTSIDGDGNILIADQDNRRIRRVDVATQVITTVAGIGTPGFSGDGGPAVAAQMSPEGVAFGVGAFYITDNSRIRKVTLPGGGFALAAVKSRKIHGARGPFELTVNHAQPINGNLTVEPRTVGSGHTLVFQFNDAVNSVGAVTAANLAGESVNVISVETTGNEIRVSLGDVRDNSRVKISLANVNGSLNTAASVGFLVGDINSSRSVNASDIAGLRAHSSQAATIENFRFDLNLSGDIDSADVAAAKARSGRVLL